MTNQKLLSRLYEIDVRADPATKVLLRGLIEDVEQDIRAEKAGNSSAFKIACAILKRNKKEMPNKPGTHGAVIIGNAQYFMSPTQCFELIQHLPLWDVPTDAAPFDYKRAMQLFPGKDELELDLPDISELKAWLKIQKARQKLPGYRFCFGDGLPVVNAERLAEVLTILPGCRAVVDSSRARNGAIGFWDDKHNRALLLPLHSAAEECERTNLTV